ncbi:FtsX-like permease family protein [candidate division KSB1 bacterium]|nr:FtsX-like permease family protein [candidate division KSB1 bacterium]RQW07720.1 MAG: FtsX-like permease family protein [candidate division KSB1 bacterium]
MTIFQLAIKEIARRKLNFILGLISVIMAVTIFIGAMTMLNIHDIRTEQIVAQKEKETKQRMLALEDDYRKIMKNLGFNLLIIPADQNLGDLYADDFASKYMTETDVEKLARAKIMTMRHLLPSLQQKIKWPERHRTIILIGTRGEVPFLHRDPREPILVAVPKGTAIVGYELATSLNIKVDDKIKLLDRTFTVRQCNEERGSKDDITIWIDLQEAQELLHRPGEINAILALKCHCAGNDIAQVRQDVAAILPDVQVIEHGTHVLTRAEARDRAKKEAQEALQAEIRHRQRLREEREQFSAILAPLVTLAGGISIALLFFANVRDRRSEIGILRAIGVRRHKILFLFLAKAALMGGLGAVAGYLIGAVAGMALEGVITPAALNGRSFVIALLLALSLSLMASWIPAYLASQQDPAAVLREE